MAVLTSHTTGYDTDAGIGDIATNETRRGQSFQIAKDGNIDSVELYLKNGSSPPTDPITVRIETNSAGVPSGTLAHANATTTILAASITGSLAYVSALFTRFKLLKLTTYHIVASVPSQSNNVNFVWGVDSSQGYASGVLSTSQNLGAWSNNALDGLFKVNGVFITGGAHIAFEI